MIQVCVRFLFLAYKNAAALLNILLNSRFTSVWSIFARKGNGI